jgi:hypothetical protein
MSPASEIGINYGIVLTAAVKSRPTTCLHDVSGVAKNAFDAAAHWLITPNFPASWENKGELCLFRLLGATKGCRISEGHSTVDLVLTFDPHLAFQPAAAVMNNRAGAALAGLAMTDIHALRLSGRDRPQLTAVALGDPFHLLAP